MMSNYQRSIINIQDINDNKSCKLCLVRHLYPADHNPVRIREVDKCFARELDFKYIK